MKKYFINSLIVILVISILNIFYILYTSRPSNGFNLSSETNATSKNLQMFDERVYFNQLKNKEDIYTNKNIISSSIFKNVDSVELTNEKNTSKIILNVNESSISIPNEVGKFRYETTNSDGETITGYIYFDNTPVKLTNIENDQFYQSGKSSILITTNKPVLMVETDENGYNFVSSKIINDSCLKNRFNIGNELFELTSKCKTEWLETTKNEILISNTTYPQAISKINLEIYDYFGNKLSLPIIENFDHLSTYYSGNSGIFPYFNNDVTQLTNNLGLKIDNLISLDKGYYSEYTNIELRRIDKNNLNFVLHFKLPKNSKIDLFQPGRKKIDFVVDQLDCFIESVPLLLNSNVQQGNELCNFKVTGNYDSLEVFSVNGDKEIGFSVIEPSGFSTINPVITDMNYKFGDTPIEIVE